MIKATEYCKNVFDGTHDSPKPVEKGYRLLTSKNIMSGYLDKTDSYFISEEDYIAINKRSKVYKWDILFSMIGTVGNVCIITDDNIDFAIKNMGVFSCRDEYEAKWLYFYLQSPYIRKINENYLNGAIQKFLPLGRLRELEIVPFDNEKKKIVDLLWSIEEKLRKNNLINNELESMAKTLYNYWFLQFEFPNENGKPYKSSGRKMVWNEELKREIPGGWKVDNLMESSLCEDIKSGVNYFETKKIYLPTANIIGEEITDGEYISFDNRESRANMQPVKNSVWFAKMKNSIKHLTIPENSDWFISKYILSTGFQGLKCSADSLAYIHCLINSDWFEKYKDVLSHGATQESVNNEDLKNIKFAVPTQEILKRFAEIVNPIIEKKFQIIKENQELVSLRDFLLPLLMNGQVKFKDN